MSQFYGCCSFPHGGWTLTGLLLSCMAALGATIYGVASCRFAYVDFQSDRGDFANLFLDPTPNGAPVTYRAGIGLFTALVPFDETNWADGQCAGYTEVQRDNMSDNTFEAARVFGVLSVMAGIGVVLWSWFLSCLSLGKIQIWMMSSILFALTIFVGFCFLLFQSALCQELVSYQDPSYSTECTLDQGGLVAIAAAILWLVSFLITIIYIKSPEEDMTILPNGQISNAFELRQLERAKQRREQQKLRRKLERREREMETQPSQESHRHQSPRPDPPSASIDTYNDGMTEVQLGGHRKSQYSEDLTAEI